jgi:hypothetical protein
VVFLDHARYLSAVYTLVKVVLSLDPRLPTTVMIATEIPAAMSPYSMAVAPVSSRKKCRMVLVTVVSSG